VSIGSILQNVEQTVYLSYVLRVLGVVMLAGAMFMVWHQVGFFTKFLLFTAPIAWFVGARFDKVYR
jgi:hypothetical protein